MVLGLYRPACNWWIQKSIMHYIAILLKGAEIARERSGCLTRVPTSDYRGSENLLDAEVKLCNSATGQAMGHTWVYCELNTT